MVQKVTVKISAALKTSTLNSVTLKVEAVGSSETSENSILHTTQYRSPNEGHHLNAKIDKTVRDKAINWPSH